jgi:nicotinate-nucleotide adenylyltransferase
MVELAVAGHPAFKVERVEKEMLDDFHRRHPDQPLPPTYTFETLEELHRRRPDDELFLLIGSDALNDLPVWRRPRRILELAGLLVMGRPGQLTLSADQFRAALGLAADAPLHFQVVQAPLIEVSSTDLRARVAAGRSIRYFLPRAVEVYIQDRGLYRNA